MNNVLHTKNIATFDKFDIVFSALVDDSPEIALDRETLDEIAVGNLVVFTAQIEVKICGVTLATEYLGCCIYNSYDEFIEIKDSYFQYMKNEALAAAKIELDSIMKQLQA